jgi:F0F1-type ATP synthase membrane subunit b/b'
VIRNQVDEARGKLTEAQLKAKEYKDRTGKELKQAVNTFDSTIEKKAREAEEYKERTGKEMNKAIDSFDKTVEKKAAEAKTGISSWFGFGGK